MDDNKIINSSNAKILFDEINKQAKTGYRVLKVWYEIRLVTIGNITRYVTYYFVELTKQQDAKRPSLNFKIGPVIDQFIPDTEV